MSNKVNNLDEIQELKIRLSALEKKVNSLIKKEALAVDAVNTLSFSESLIFELIKSATIKNPIHINEISEQVFDYTGESQIYSVRVHISRIRVKVKRLGKIKCASRRGYYFVEG